MTNLWTNKRYIAQLKLIVLVVAMLLVLDILLAGTHVISGPVWAAPEPHQALNSLDRAEDAVIVTGDKMPSFDGVALDQLFVYVYTGGAWRQIPWQFDEVANGHITATEDAQLDADDQLVFMASDSGDQAPAWSWISNADSQQYPRYEIMVFDPINPSKKGWVYVYRSSTDIDTVTTDYVDYDEAQWLFTARRYILGIIPYRITAERLEMNGSGKDILDRSKIRIYILKPSYYLLTEDQISLADDPIIRDGRVRALAILSEGSNEISLIGYRSTYEFLFDLDFSPWIDSIEWMRLSADLSPDAIGSIYYDANTSDGVIVDGQGDPVATSPPTDWWQVSGDSGTIIQIADLAQLGGTACTNYYKDDKTIDPNDTGDKCSYSDCGAYVEHPNPHLVIHLWYHVLPANQPNVGATYWNYIQHPLQSVANEQQCNSTAGAIYLPIIVRSY